MKKSQYNLIYDLEKDEKLIYNTRTLGLSILEDEEFDVYKTIELHHSKTKLISDLYQSGFIVDDDCDELKILSNRLNSERFSKDVLRLTIAPTLNCNFSCTYCYEKSGENKTNVIMSDNICEKLIEFIKKRANGFKKLDVVWYGGEPLLALEVIEKISTELINICEERNMIYTGSMVTNGFFLNKNVCERIKRINVSTLQITIDGPAKVHDERRMLLNGIGTYDKILDNLKSLCDTSLNVALRVNIDKSNSNYVSQLIDEISKLNQKNITINFANVMLKDNSDNVFTLKEFSEIWLREIDYCEKCGLNHNSYCLPKGANFCDADSDNSFVIDPEGYIYKCWKDIGNRSNSIGYLNSNPKFSALYYDYMTYDATRDEICKKCNLLPLCMGGCPYERIHNGERCPMYTNIMKDIITRLAKQI